MARICGRGESEAERRDRLIRQRLALLQNQRVAVYDANGQVYNPGGRRPERKTNWGSFPTAANVTLIHGSTVHPGTLMAQGLDPQRAREVCFQVDENTRQNRVINNDGRFVFTFYVNQPVHAVTNIPPAVRDFAQDGFLYAADVPANTTLWNSGGRLRTGTEIGVPILIQAVWLRCYRWDQPTRTWVVNNGNDYQNW